ncbi:agrin-like [Ischnura elegans]|uniref:agrin-like n=1 Tax=Ischnura elegans TaxID=197161 RepID=UPI001ED87A2D|nr:agrin-like [Ischnura elegans]
MSERWSNAKTTAEASASSSPAVPSPLAATLLLLAALSLSAPKCSRGCYVFPPGGGGDPCAAKQCPAGARCVPAPDGRSATCECPERCPVYGDHAGAGPICGDDAKDYPSLCHLRKAACTAGVNVALRYHGKCDPCATVTCPAGEVCQLDGDRSAVCRCGGDGGLSGVTVSGGSGGGAGCPPDFNPVCGSDGKTYANECTLRVESCRTRRPLRIIYRGTCSSGANPCVGVSCGPGQSCIIDRFGIAHCECPPECEPVLRPVCGSDGATYDSPCALARAACLLAAAAASASSASQDSDPPNTSLLPTLAHTGPCGGVGPCSRRGREPCGWGAECVEKGGEAVCECPPPASCPSDFSPVCGSDGVSYPNECRLRLAACEKRKDLKVLYGGQCDGCERKRCEHYSRCEAGNGLGGEARCICPGPCPDTMEDNPVCGTDGKTYRSECDLQVASCKSEEFIAVTYEGDCELCRHVRCKWGAVCVAGECVCPSECEGASAEPVCASDGRTYASECLMMMAACAPPPTHAPAPPSLRLHHLRRPTRPLTVLFYGDCRERAPPAGLATPTPPSLASAAPVTSPPATPTPPTLLGGLRPGGGSNSVLVGGSEARGQHALRVEACRDIHCDFDATCELGPDLFPRCSCRFECAALPPPGSPDAPKPVCGSDLRLYPSVCAMKMEACQRQEELRLRPLDLCQGMEVRPCGGTASPLRDPVTGIELDCGSGPGRRDCPPATSYCHQTPNFARCCPKPGVPQPGPSPPAAVPPTPSGCEESWFGCCPDGRTAALGRSHAGCPSLCLCNKLGSYSETCDPDSGQCSCRPGVGGLRCDRCEPGYWGLPKISEGHRGCISCGCSLHGSVREDCEQMTGRCVCKPGVHGQKCTLCSTPGRVLGPTGCVPEGSLPTESPVRRSTVLRSTAPEDVVSSPLYKSTRHLLMPPIAPHYHHHATPYHEFSGSPEEGTIDMDSALGQLQTRPDTPSGDRWGNRQMALPAYRPTPATVIADSNGIMGFRPTSAAVFSSYHYTRLLGDSCMRDSDCSAVEHAVCEPVSLPGPLAKEGKCACRGGYAEMPDGRECLANTPPIHPTEEFKACASQPCLRGGSCIDLPASSSMVSALPTSSPLPIGEFNNMGTTGFRCLCDPALGTGPLCADPPIPKAYEIPAFDGRSYVRLKRLKAYNKLSIEVEFKTYAKDGILLYNQQKSDGTGDFVSLAIVNGYVEFRYNLGNGPVVIQSHERVRLRTFHRAVAKRYHRDGMLRLDNGEDVAGQSSGSLRALDLLEDAYVGYVPTEEQRVFENIGTSVGLTGCIRRLKVGRRVVELHEGRDALVEEAVGVAECGENPCAALPCAHAATCRPIDTTHFLCLCPPEFTGERCEIRMNPCSPNPCAVGSTCSPLPPPRGGFECRCAPGWKGRLCNEQEEQEETFVADFGRSGGESPSTSWVELPRPEGVGRSLSIEVWFLARKADGLLLYAAQLPPAPHPPAPPSVSAASAQSPLSTPLIRRSDFVALNLVSGHLQFLFDLGSGIANITSPDKITLNEWHAVKASRLEREGSLQVDNGVIARGSSGPPLSELNLDLPLYVGGIPEAVEVSRDSGVKYGFRGAIQRLVVNGEIHEGAGAGPTGHARATGGHVGRYEGPPCHPGHPMENDSTLFSTFAAEWATSPGWAPDFSSPTCLNGGLCRPLLSKFICRCPAAFVGERCETAVEDVGTKKPVRFTGETFLPFHSRLHKGTNTTNQTNFELEEDENDEGEEEDDEGVDMDEEMSEEYGNEDEEDMYDEDDVDFFDKGRRGERRNHFLIRFRVPPGDPGNGLLLWTNKGNTLQGDFFAIAIVNGYPQLSFNLGRQKNLLTIRSKVRVTDGAWHSLVAHRRKRIGMLTVDGETPSERGVADPGASLLNTNGRLWIGGAPALPAGLPAQYYLGFIGCIEEVKVDKKKSLDLLKHGLNTVTQFCPV